MSSHKFFPLSIKSIRSQTDNGVGITFDIPDNLRDVFAFTPGQHLTLRAQVGGEDIRRSYSICSAAQSKCIEVGIKRVPDGAFSNFAHTLRVGDVIDVMPPQGRFTAPVGGSHNYLLLAAGSGITPCLSIAKSILQGEDESEITLIYGNQRLSSVMFRKDIDDLKDQYLDRFRVFHVMSREQQDVDFLNGRLDGRLVEKLTRYKLLDIAKLDAAYLCGPQGMIETLQVALKKLGMENDKIHFELFNTGPIPVSNRVREDAQAGARVTIVLDGSQKDVVVDGVHDTILSAAQKSGLDLPFSCAGGMCCTCRCKVISGEASMDVNYSLQDWEVEAGFTLACQARPKSKTLTLDFDDI